jgi:hypothetical protein
MASKLVALVIGASRGIGRQVAIDLSKNGYAGKYYTSQSTYLYERHHILSPIYSRRRS